ncbi:hypothetical protein GCM10022220_37210 [Actinocatenispora rupis]|uniref:Transcription regulator AsnC/Lrp ligand binding domain-containing protein n=2 Tax=Actinocatenispora rupis TaxID=519421 RepID=A0A8J3NAJ9_9ACTN|nr:hypothetical protein Aru02nite_30750 [Actinocatenispora rupis]
MGAGVVSGYTAVVDPERLGLTVLAFVRLRYPHGNDRPFHALLDSTPEIVEAHHVTGEDCFVPKVSTRSMRHLEEVTGRPDDHRQPTHPRHLNSRAGKGPGSSSSRSGAARTGALRSSRVSGCGPAPASGPTTPTPCTVVQAAP